jgi:hypothetical protein
MEQDKGFYKQILFDYSNSLPTEHLNCLICGVDCEKSECQECLWANDRMVLMIENARSMYLQYKTIKQQTVKKDKDDARKKMKRPHSP